MRYDFRFLAPLLAMALSFFAERSLAQDPALKEVEVLYSAGSFDAASQRINELLAEEAALPKAERARLYLMKARLELAYGRKQELKLWLKKAHETDPELSPDPVLDPPQIMELWGVIKRDDDDNRGSPKSVVPAQTAQPFWTMLLPLGAGHFLAGRHKDGALFLSTELLLLQTANTLTQPSTDDATEDDSDRRKNDRTLKRGRDIFGTLSLLGAYGYELTDMRSDMQLASPSGHESIRPFLSLLPFGVAQANNGDSGKALTMAALQSTFLMVGVLAPEQRHRNTALGLFGVSWVYGMIDGFVNRTPPREERSVETYRLSPNLFSDSDGQLGVGVTLMTQVN